MQSILFQSQVMSQEDLALITRSWCGCKAARSALCAMSSVPQNERSTATDYGSWVSLSNFLDFLAKLPEVNLTDK